MSVCAAIALEDTPNLTTNIGQPPDRREFLRRSLNVHSHLSMARMGPPRAECSSSAALIRSKTVDRGEHCCGHVGQCKIHTWRLVGGEELFGDVG